MSFYRIFFRNLIRHKVTFSLSMLSLSIGFSVSFVIFLWISNELAFDRFHRNLDDIYLVQIEERGQKNSIQTPLPLGPALKDEYPEIEYYSSYSTEHKVLETRKLRARVNGASVDTSFFHIFDFPLSRGSLKTAFETPHAILISQALATRFFDKDPLGETIKLQGKEHLVAGILADIPGNSSIHFEFLKIRQRKDAEDWAAWFPALFVKLKSQTDLDAFRHKISRFPKIYQSKERKVSLYPYHKVHFNVEDVVFFGRYTEWIYIQAMTMVAVLILVLTSLNFVNMSIVLYSKRSKEIGLKKVFGCEEANFRWQFMAEMLCQGILALLGGLGMLAIARYNISNLPDNDLLNQAGAVPLLMFVGGGLLVVLIASIYPAFFLSSFSPGEIFRGFKPNASKNHFLRKALIVVQFTITSFVLFCTLVLSKQMDFVKEKKLGYVAENLLAVSMEGEELHAKYPTLKHELSRDENILDISRGSIRYIYFEDKILNWEKKDQRSDKEYVRYFPASASNNFDKTAGLKIKEGRFFRPQFNDEMNVVINEETVRQLDLENPLGSRLKLRNKDFIIVGVVADFNYASVANKVQPLVFYNADESDMFIRIKPGTAKAVISNLKQVFKEVVPAHLPEYQFMADHVDDMYQHERRLESIFLGLSLICVLISVLGLFSFSSMIIQERSKIIAIKKVLGASSIKLIIGLIAWFMMWVIISYSFAVPIAFNIMDSWLQNFAYHTALSFDIFVKTVLLLIMVVVLAVISNVLKVTLKKPVELISRP